MAGINKIANFINNSPRAQKFLKKVSENTSVYAAGASFIIASGLRPAIMNCFNFKDKKDKKTSQASAIATGLVELASTVAIFIPLNKSIGKSSKALYNMQDTAYFQNKGILRQYKSVTNRVAKLLILPFVSYARFALVKPITDYISGKKKGEKK